MNTARESSAHPAIALAPRDKTGGLGRFPSALKRIGQMEFLWSLNGFGFCCPIQQGQGFGFGDVSLGRYLLAKLGVEFRESNEEIGIGMRLFGGQFEHAQAS